MAQEWLIEIAKGAGKFFLHPVFYYLFFLAAILGVSRVKRERGNFHVRAENAYFELRQLLPLGLFIGVVLSLISIAAGLVIPLETIVFTAILTILWSFTTKIRWMAPAYTLGFAFFATIFAVEQEWPLPSIFTSISDAKPSVFPAIAVLLALLLIGEGILIFKNARKGTSPKLIKSKRGQRVGIHEVKRLWMIPLFLVIPGEVLKSPFEWWPVFSIAGHSYSILLVPFAIGFFQQIQGNLPSNAIKATGKKVIWLGSIILLLSIAGYWSPIASIAVVTIAIVSREIITLRQRMADENRPFFFSKRNHGVMVLGIIPQSPASSMGLKVGEIVTKVNGIHVHDKIGFYEALLKNRAHCKLEVLDTNGQIRFAQRALYEGDHHELGILFVQEERNRGSEAV
ncbi:PDZ domain-containing protein [Cytobacillus solani]|uniref:PDZ serine protease n=1 Tax=Cytobacillus solani TaxID=1637975 RepID=A0A0Q3QWH7_9BACI|nr:PDZ domain-containing protein [Cytobacillus solani]KQL22056.1 PDZ serine protease [Cytobacillus solani]USK57665.1 PDZ domain-containing protein [Cytobacillus solani]